MENIGTLVDIYESRDIKPAKECYKVYFEAVKFQCFKWKEYYEYVIASRNILEKIIFGKIVRMLWIFSILFEKRRRIKKYRKTNNLSRSGVRLRYYYLPNNLKTLQPYPRLNPSMHNRRCSTLLLTNIPPSTHQRILFQM
jgi:hypothetical protein